MSPDPPASQPPVFQWMPVWEPSPQERPDPQTPAASKGDLDVPDGQPGEESEEKYGVER